MTNEWVWMNLFTHTITEDWLHSGFKCVLIEWPEERNCPDWKDICPVGDVSSVRKWELKIIILQMRRYSVSVVILSYISLYIFISLEVLKDFSPSNSKKKNGKWKKWKNVCRQIEDWRLIKVLSQINAITSKMNERKRETERVGECLEDNG